MPASAAVIKVHELECPNCHQQIGDISQYPEVIRPDLQKIWDTLSRASLIAHTRTDLGCWIVCFNCANIFERKANTLLTPRLENWPKVLSDPEFFQLLKSAQSLISSAKRVPGRPHSWFRHAFALVFRFKA